MAPKRTSAKAKSRHVFGQARKRPKCRGRACTPAFYEPPADLGNAEPGDAGVLPTGVHCPEPEKCFGIRPKHFRRSSPAGVLSIGSRRFRDTKVTRHGERAYRMAMAASDREDAAPMVTTSGTALPVGALVGMSRFICTSPEYTRPSNAIVAAGTATPPRLTLTGSMGVGKGGPVGWAPSASVVFTRPCPVSQNAT